MCLAADRVEYDIHVRDLFGEVLRPIVDDHVGAESPRDLETLAGSSRNHARAGLSGELDGEAADAAGSGMDPVLLASLQFCDLEQSLPGSARCCRDAGGILQRDRRGRLRQVRGGYDGKFSHSTTGRRVDTSDNLVALAPFLDVCAHLFDLASEIEISSV